MLTEQALPHVEVRYLSHRMYPADLIEGLFDTVSGLCIIAHNLASTDISADINLPEYGSPVPHLGCTHFVEIEQPICLILACNGGKVSV